jgi:hypothetical protein
MELFLSGVLIVRTLPAPSFAPGKNHSGCNRRALAAGKPLDLEKKHVVWFLENRSSEHGQATQYYYVLTVRLLDRRLETSWVFSL